MNTSTRNQWVNNLPLDKLDNWITAHGDKVKRIYDTDDVYFGLWMAYVSRAVNRRTGGLSPRDLEDWGYADAYESGLTPYEAAEAMLADNGYDDYDEEMG